MVEMIRPSLDDHCMECQSVNKSAKWHCGRHTLICKKNTN